jgi:hypothetical protein
MHSLRFNPFPEWKGNGINWFFLGFNQMLVDLSKEFMGVSNLKMLEIGSYQGESTFLFASLGIFDEIHCIDPFTGYEEANDLFGNDWNKVKHEFDLNTRYFDNIILHQDFSYNIYNKFQDDYFDFIYIDGNHEYEDVKKDLELYLPKCKYIIAGHDYTDNWPSVVDAVKLVVGVPDKLYPDSSWLKLIK